MVYEMSSTHDFLLLSQLHSSLSRIRHWLLGPAAVDKQELTLDREVADAQELAEAMERVMPRVYAQAFALANKSESLAYCMTEWKQDGCERMRKVLDMEKTGDRPKGMNEVRDSLSYLVELENLKLSVLQASSSPSPQSTHSPQRSTPNASAVSLSHQFLTIYSLLGLNPSDSLLLRDLLSEDGSLNTAKVQSSKLEDVVQRFISPMLDLASAESAGTQAFVQRAEAERLTHACGREFQELVTAAMEMCGQSLEGESQECRLQPWPDCLPSLTAHMRLSLLRLQQSILALSQSHRTHTSALHTLNLSNSLLKSILKAREQELETLGEEYYTFATQNTVSNESSRRRLLGSPSAQRLPASRQESDTFSDLRSPLTGRLMTSFPEEEEVHTEETLGRAVNPVQRALGNAESLEKFALVLHLDSERRTETLQTAFKLWIYSVRSLRLVTDMCTSTLESVSLEGAYKAKVLKNNPIVGLLSANILNLNDMLPSYQLFPILFQILDESSCQSDVGKPFPDLTLDYLSLNLPIKTKVYQFLGDLLLSLQSFYSEGYTYAVLFARLLRVYNPDPLLDQITFCILRLNAYLMDVALQGGAKALSVKMTDEEAGGNVFLSTALELAFRLPFSSDQRLLSHFLSCIQPVELSPVEWAAFVVACKADHLMLDLSKMDFSTIEEVLEFVKTALALESVVTLLDVEGFAPTTLTNLINPQVYADIKGFLFMPRGFLLDAFLQVYDLYIDSLFPLISQFAPEASVTESQYRLFLQSVCPVLNSDEKADIWRTATELSSEESTVTRDAGLLAVIACDNSLLSAKPLYLPEVEVRSPAGHSRGISFAYRNGRVAVSFREERKQQRRKTSAMQGRYGRVRVRRDMAGSRG